MKKYKNTRTGATIEVASVIRGADWVLVDKLEKEQEPEVKVDKQPKVVEEVEGDDADLDGITKTQIMQELDAFGVEYDKRAKKQVLYDLMMSQGE